MLQDKLQKISLTAPGEQSNGENQPLIYNHLYSLIIGAAVVYSLTTLLMDYRYSYHFKYLSLILNILFLIYFTGAFLFKRFLSGKERERILIITCLLIAVNFTISHSQHGREKYDLHTWLNQIMMGFVFLIISIGSIVRMYRSFTRLTTISSFTGLGNNRWLMEQINCRIQKGIPLGTLILIDLKNFRIVTSLYGKKYGDKLIRMIAEILQSYSCENLIVAHAGGGEFCLWYEWNDSELLYNKIYEIKEKIKQSAHISHENVNIRVHTSSACYPKDGDTYFQLYSRASMAMDQFQSTDRSSHTPYTPKMEQALRSENTYSYEIRKALKKKEFHLCYQPKYNLEGSRIHSIEALARWDSPSMGTVSPDVFIPLLQNMNLLNPFTELIIQKVFSDMTEIHNQFGSHVSISVNIPPCYFNNPGMVSFIQSALRKNNINPEKLVFEITESTFIGNFEITRKKIEELHRMGIRISLDDFGTGYSSLSYLQNLSIYELKIDKSFIDGIHLNNKSFTLVNAICDIAHSQGYKIVAEGVENKDQIRMLEKTSCDLVQGYIYSKPIKLNAKSQSA